MDKKQLLFDEMNTHLCKDTAPEAYFRSLDTSVLGGEYPFVMLDRLKGIKQSPKFHPEGNVWNHTMLVVGEAAKRKAQSSDERAFMWAALLHDIGKAETTKVRGGRITSYDHDKAGARLTYEFLSCFAEDARFVRKVTALVRWHMQILYVVKDLPYADVRGMKEQVAVRDAALLGMCDRLGRCGAEWKAEEENIRVFLRKCESSKD